MKIGFIGLGNMGASLAKAVLHAKTGDDLLLANRSQAKVDAFIADFGGQTSSSEEIFAEADVIFLGVKSLTKPTQNYSNDAKYPCFYWSRSD